jgi:hypothetical protein
MTHTDDGPSRITAQPSGLTNRESDERSLDLAAIHDVCAHIVELADELDQREPLAPAERISAWHHVAAAAEALAVVVSQMNADALDAMHELGQAEWATDIGMVHIHRKPGAQHWRGRALLHALGRPLVDRESGEVTEAVPVEVLERVVPGVEGTSSRWLTTDLDEFVADWKSYRTFGEATYEVRPGGKPRR